MNKTPLFRRVLLVIGLVALPAAGLWLLSSDPRSAPLIEQLAQQLVQTGLEFYRDNPTPATLLIAAAVALPTGYLFALIWPRRGLTTYLSPYGDRPPSR